jgi:two-component system sensor histidine kinase YesM
MCIPEELLDVRIPQLTIQPLVENSIKYALEAMLETCNIRLFGRVEGDTAVLVVEDNGPGIDPLILEKLKAGTVEAKGHGIGLQNIHKRVQLRFSEAYGLQIRRENGKTQIQVRVPYAPEQ